MLIIILLLLFLAVGYIVLNVLYKQTNYYKNSMLSYDFSEKDIPYHLTFVNLGSTYSQYAFGCYKELGFAKAYNLALPCESSEADWVKLRLLSPHLAPNCIVAITLAPCNTLYSWGQLDEGIKHYGYMTKSEKKDWRLIKFIKYHLPLFPFGLRQIAKILLDTQLKKDMFELKSSRICTEEESEKRSKGTADSWCKMFGLVDLKQPVHDEKNKAKISENTNNVLNMIDFCQQNHYIPIIVIPPFLGKLNCYFGEFFIDSTLGRIYKGAKEKGVLVYDYREFPEFQNNNGLYIDGYFCLNKYGSIKFVKSLFSQLNNDGIIINNEKLCL